MKTLLKKIIIIISFTNKEHLIYFNIYINHLFNPLPSHLLISFNYFFFFFLLSFFKKKKKKI